MSLRVVLPVSLILVSVTFLAVVFAARPEKTLPPLFTIEWQEGHCGSCQTAHENIAVLDTIRFINRREAWALGVSFPVHEGVPDYTVLHTSDSGRTWSEVARAVQTHRKPVFSFSDAANGWIVSWNFMDGASLSRDELMRRRDPQVVRQEMAANTGSKFPIASLIGFSFFLVT
jgi:hypothetical protein